MIRIWKRKGEKKEEKNSYLSFHLDQSTVVPPKVGTLVTGRGFRLSMSSPPPFPSSSWKKKKCYKIDGYIGYEWSRGKERYLIFEFSVFHVFRNLCVCVCVSQILLWIRFLFTLTDLMLMDKARFKNQMKTRYNMRFSGKMGFRRSRCFKIVVAPTDLFFLFFNENAGLKLRSCFCNTDFFFFFFFLTLFRGFNT